MNDQSILVERRAGYRIVTLNRPDRLNAFNEAMHVALRQAIDEAEADADCRALMITGAGRGFCAGQDLNDRLAKPGETVVLGAAQEQHYNPLVRKLRALPFPVIAAVNGVAAGAGCNIALACDIVLAAARRVSSSLSPASGWSRIRAAPGSCRGWSAMRAPAALALLAEPLPAEKAEDWGLIWQCVDDASSSPRRRNCANTSPRRRRKGWR